MRELKEILEPGMNLVDLIERINVDFKFFYEKVLGFNEKGGLNKYKQEWFNLAYENDYVMIKAASGFAKTTVLGVAFPIWWILTHPNTKILLISKTLTQSKDALLLQIRDLIDDNEFLKKTLKPEDKDAIWNQTQIRTENNCSVINRPYSISIKGYRANIIILDEIDSYEDPSIYFDHVLSRLIPGGKIIGISTPEEGTNTLMDLIKLREHENDDCIFKIYPALVNFKGDAYDTGESIWSEEFPVSELIKRLRRFGKQKWMKNYMCDSMTEGENSIFSARSIESCKDYELSFTSQNYNEEIYIGCMPPGSLINTNKGLTAIEHIKMGDKVLTHRSRYRKVCKKYVREYNGKIYRFRVIGQPLPIEVTGEHPLLISREGKLKWIKSKDVLKTDYLTMPYNYSKDSSNKEDKAKDYYIIGRWLADGWITQNRICLSIGLGKSTKEIEEILNRQNISFYKRERQSNTEISFMSIKYLKMLYPYGRGAKNKKIDSSIYDSLNKKFIANLLRGYFEGDGCIYQDKRRKGILGNAVSISIDLLLGIQRLLFSLEIFSRISVMRDAKKSKIQGRIVNQQKTYQLFLSINDTKKLLYLFGINVKHQSKHNSRAKFIRAKNSSSIEDKFVKKPRGYVATPIRSINCYNYNGKVYNFSIDSDESYCNQNIITHNCDYALSSSPTGDFDATVVIGKKKDIATIKFAEVKKGVPVDIKVARLEELNELYNPISFICDKSGIGAEIIRQLRIKGLPVEEQGFMSNERNLILNNLKALLDNHKIVIPKEKDDLQAVEFANKLEYELFSFKEKKSESTGQTSYISKGTHDDTVVGLAMAVKHVNLLQDFEDPIGVSNGSDGIIQEESTNEFIKIRNR